MSGLFYFEIFDSKEDRATPLIIIGGLMLIPGGYYFWIILCILFGVRNYSLDDIPEFNN